MSRSQHMHGIDVCAYCAEGDVAAHETVPMLLARLRVLAEALALAPPHEDTCTCASPSFGVHRPACWLTRRAEALALVQDEHGKLLPYLEKRP